MKKFGFKPTPAGHPYTPFTKLQSYLKPGSSGDQYIIQDKAPVFDQLGLQSCVANSTCTALEILMGVEGIPVVPLSRLFVYWNARIYNQDTGKDEGTFIANAFDSLKSLGVCTESDWLYQEPMVFTRPNLTAYKNGNDNTITDYYRIDSVDEMRLNDIERAIRADHPVVFGTTIGAELENYSGQDKVFSPPTSHVGGHAMCCIGVRRNPNLEFYVKNSWGTRWGIGGYFWMSADYMMWDQTNDLWVPTRIPNII